jgi:putative tryptophan/tyrosine transport system substrate-binding protein
VRRREFIRLLGGIAVIPLGAHAQEGGRMRRVGIIMPYDNTDQRENLVVFLQVLQQSGWVDGRNVRIETRWAGGNAAEIRKHTDDLVALAPDVIFANGTASLPLLMLATRSIPIVFANVADPVGAGFVDTMARPGRNATGFVQFEYSLSGKWLELLKQVAPNVTRVAVLRDQNITSGIGQFAVIQAMAPAVGMEVSAISVADAGEIERGIATFARSPNGGLILTASALAAVHGESIIGLADQYRLPAVYYRRYFAKKGGLIAYGYDIVQQFRGAADYVDRILKGAKPADLPVQAPTKYELAVNLKTARALGLSMPDSMLARADEIIE